MSVAGSPGTDLGRGRGAVGVRMALAITSALAPAPVHSTELAHYTSVCMHST